MQEVFDWNCRLWIGRIVCLLCLLAASSFVAVVVDDARDDATNDDDFLDTSLQAISSQRRMRHALSTSAFCVVHESVTSEESAGRARVYCDLCASDLRL